MKNMLDTEVVHVVIPIYNVCDYVDECVESIVDQLYRNLDIILVDDGSTDGSQDCCDKWAQHDKRIRVVHQTNQGLSAARNTGLKMISDGFVFFIDSDDKITSSYMIGSCVERMKRTKQDIVFFGYHEGTSLENSDSIQLTDSEEIVPDLLLKIASAQVHSYAWHFMSKTALYKDISFPDGRMAEDLATTYKIVARAEHGLFVPECYYFYRQRSGSIVHKKTSYDHIKYYMDEMASYHEMIEFLKEYDHSIYVAGYNAFLKHFISHLGFAKQADVIKWLKDTICNECVKMPSDVIDNNNKFKLFLIKLSLFRFIFNFVVPLKKMIVKH
ncbi:glycosyltransferase family 2 protein [Bifidobacterium scardovii]|uniref:Glycosyltransferase n=1 Tax=Bifidobacterium scardovii TaxID=158787 RepID=A0A087D332_9BIFI|nr:glycosyltransferase family 2 protein [Bifidobacterium scardovii]KFI89932.1 glycosyltransferase [Bifidobacterium scardovii]MDK6350680.1 glycosyltransferase family 2 protein [Bifidobacterium scardovii]MDU8982877.1 glycosyltransferase family 2 protein [Bifidobacterium scardovii]BAQ32193.1 putative glycosyltransferase [Bifidobacterium scardovii JCM 12489 = DSM 13734]